MQFGENQTDADDLQGLTDGQHMGTGIFAIANPNEPFPAFAKVVVVGIAYPDCCRRGAACLAFKWVPRILNASSTACPKPPFGMLCVKSCANDLCLCIDGQCA